MTRALLLLGVTAAIAGFTSFAVAGAARAEDEYVYCRASADDPDVQGGLVGGRGTINCTATAQWTLEVCLQKWVRPDDQFYDVSCRSRAEEMPSGYAPVREPCDYWGYGEYRLFVHAAWWYAGGSYNDWAISNVTWDC
jgi:hypothetical protein